MSIKVSVFLREYDSGAKSKWGIRWHPDGAKHPLRKIIGNKKEAELAAAAKHKELLESEMGIPIRKVISLDALYNEFISGKRKLQESSINRYNNLFKPFNKYIKNNYRSSHRDIAKIKKYYIDEYANHLIKDEGMAPKTVNGAIDLIRQVFSYAVKEDYLTKSPARDVEKFQLQDEKEAPYFTKKELIKIWENSNEHWVNFFKILYYTGMRKSELINLTWKNVNLKKGEESVTVISSEDFRTKTGRKRTIPLHRDAIDIIKGQQGKHKKYVFVSKEGKIIHRDKPYRNLKAALKRAGLEGDVHKMRHTMASHAILKGVSIYEIKEILGHQNIQTTMIYSHLAPNTLRKAINKLESFNYHL